MENSGMNVQCNPHPDAPHSFMRDASHSAGRYVCECESWEPPKREWVGLTQEEFDAVVPYCHNEFDLKEFKDFACAIEAKLKEKNT